MIDGPGLFGKSPETGDFISRNLSQGMRRAIDGWVTVHLAARREGWPDGGLRGLLEIGDDLVLMLAVPSADRVGRHFPLVVLTGGAGLSLEEAEVWCDGALEIVGLAARGEVGIDATLQDLRQIEPGSRDGPSGIAALWLAGDDPAPCDATTIDALFSSD
ncbi:type VI secretion system-associated protein TagF [Rhodobacteraceae bacterium]|nr:type VI secretion system-associated protein TagF [Paracoccaceae bacterium]